MDSITIFGRPGGRDFKILSLPVTSLGDHNTMSRKRKYDNIEAIDLTGDDSSPVRSQQQQHVPSAPSSQVQRSDGYSAPSSQVQHSSFSSATSSHVPRDNDLIPDDEYEADTANDVVVLSQGNDDEARLTFQVYGVVNTRIVGVQYYRGYASEGE